MKQKLQDEITQTLHSAPLVKNLARKKFVAAFILALIQSRKVQFNELAHHLNDEAKLDSNQNRIEDFFRDLELDYVMLATLLLSLLPRTVKLRICLDRTEWDFGKTQVNILMVLVGHGDLQLPLFWTLLDNKSGNSSSQDRIDLLERVFKVVDKNRVGLVVADREFVGQKWIKYLKEKGLNFVMRFPKHHLLTDAEAVSWRIEELALELNQGYCFTGVLVDGCVGNVWLLRLWETEFLYLFGNLESRLLGQLYRKRWSIEVCFQNLKGRGFDLGKTHLLSLSKLSKLVGLVSLGYAFCGSMGLYLHRKVQPIKIKKHGYKSASFARHGLNNLRAVLRPQRPKRKTSCHGLFGLVRSPACFAG
ncbi:MAG: IS4 family transposase [Cytophagales bacterium]|nr:MAG: IS4 family transposase [Cytophagales bacterium]